MNAHTRRFKAALNNLLEHSADDMIIWLQEIDCPVKRFAVLKDFAEYIYPKLARVEQQTTETLVDKNGEKILKEDIEILKNAGVLSELNKTETIYN